jgi:ArsR family transcriptional regulator, arsenate/arsenite/antimonite-responsive transcriptional repressor
MDQIINITKALSDGSRLRVVMTLKDCKELCVCQITELLGLATPTISRHMSVLQQAGLVKSRKDGRWVYYRLSEAFPPLLLQWLEDGLTDSHDMARDKEKMTAILSCGLDGLCQAQKRRRELRAG